MSRDLLEQLQQRLNLHESQQLIRKRLVRTPQKSWLDFTYNDYLSLSQHPDVIKTLQESVQALGFGASGSPITHYTQAHQALEDRIAKWLNYPRALVFTSGYLAMQSSITALIGRKDLIAVDKQCHACVFDAIELTHATWQRYADHDFERLEKILQTHSDGLRFIITSSVFSMQGHLAHFDHLMHLAKKYNATLIIDDVHGTGVLGSKGEGCKAFLDTTQQMPLIIGSLTKGLGTLGAFVAGDEIMIEAILQFARPYMFSSTLPSALASASITAIDLAEQASSARSHLHTLSHYFQQQAKALDFNILPSSSPIQAIVFPDINRMQHTAHSLLEKNILVSAIRSPTVPKSSPRIRMNLTAAHQIADIDRLLAGFTNA